MSMSELSTLYLSMSRIEQYKIHLDDEQLSNIL